MKKFWQRSGEGSSPSRHQRGNENATSRKSTSVSKVQAGKTPPLDSALVEQHGMHIWQDQPKERLNKIDIVAIHGLNGHYDKTWQATTESGDIVNWIKDFLPQQMPEARIMSWGYNSKVLFSKSEADIPIFANMLLENLLAYRDVLSRRPIIFICHSLGGLVVKKALILANEKERYKDGISKSIRGILFFGTPHKGAALANWSTLLSNIVKISSLGVHTHSKLSKDLEMKSRILQEISNSFVERAKELIILTFHETDKMDFLNCKVVEDSSSILGLPNEIVIPMIGDHRTICRFSSIHEQRYRNVWVNLQRLVTSEINRSLTAEERTCHQMLYSSEYESYIRRNQSPAPGTCLWLLRHPMYKKWSKTPISDLLWISANPGCGKSVLATFLVDHLKGTDTRNELPQVICYFFFKDDNDLQRSAMTGLAALLHQLYAEQPTLLKHIFTEYQEKGPGIFNQFHTMWNVLLKTLTDDETKGQIVFILDGLDECEPKTQQKLLSALATFYKSEKSCSKSLALKTIILSRPDNDIKVAFYKLPTIRLKGEDETEAINKDIETVVQTSIDEIVDQGLPQDILDDFRSILIQGADRTFLWTTMVIGLLKDAAKRGASKREMRAIIVSDNVYAIYQQFLGNTSNTSQVTKLLHLIVAAARPLSVLETSIAFAVTSDQRHITELDQDIPRPFENHITYLCGHFLRVIQDKVYFVHQTAREFLLESPDSPLAYRASSWQHSIFLEEANLTMVQSCVWYLSLFYTGRYFSTINRQSRDRLGALRDFLDYSARYWPAHFRESSGKDEAFQNSLMARCAVICRPYSQGFPIWFGRHFYYDQDREKYEIFMKRKTAEEAALALDLTDVADYIDQHELEEARPEELDDLQEDIIDDLQILIQEMERELPDVAARIHRFDRQSASMNRHSQIPGRPRDIHELQQPHTQSNAFLQHSAVVRNRFVVKSPQVRQDIFERYNYDDAGIRAHQLSAQNGSRMKNYFPEYDGGNGY